MGYSTYISRKASSAFPSLLGNADDVDQSRLKGLSANEIEGHAVGSDERPRCRQCAAIQMIERTCQLSGRSPC